MANGPILSVIKRRFWRLHSSWRLLCDKVLSHAGVQGLAFKAYTVCIVLVVALPYRWHGRIDM